MDSKRKLIVLLAILTIILSLLNVVTLLKKDTLTGKAIVSNVGTATLCINQPPTLLDIAGQTATAGTLFNLAVNANDENTSTLKYYDNTSLFNIDATGSINFIPANADAGVHNILITIQDETNCSNSNASNEFVLTITAAGEEVAPPAEGQGREEGGGSGPELITLYKKNTWSVIFYPGESMELDAGDLDLAITKVIFRVTREVYDTSLRIERVNNLPQDIKPFTGSVYQYDTVTENNIGSALEIPLIIKFRANKDWLLQNQIDEDTIALFRYNDNQWQELSSIKEGNNILYVLYNTTQSPGLGLFAVASRAPSLLQSEEVKEEWQWPRFTESNLIGAAFDYNLKFLIDYSSYIIIFLLLIIIVILLIYLFRNRKKRGKK